jgi:hypothetical protein
VLTNLRKEFEKAAKDSPVLNIVDFFFDFSVSPGLPGGGSSAGWPSRRYYPTGEEDEGAYRPSGPQPAGAKGLKEPDPLFPEEDASGDTHFRIGLIVTITGDGLGAPDAAAPASP